jgi:hypothetical protein
MVQDPYTRPPSTRPADTLPSWSWRTWVLSELLPLLIVLALWAYVGIAWWAGVVFICVYVAGAGLRYRNRQARSSQ